MDKYFVYDPECGFETYATEEEAKKQAEEAIQGYLDDGWSEEVTGVCWGIIKQSAQECDRQDKPSEDELDEMDEDERDDVEATFGDFEYVCNYRLADVEPEQPSIPKCCVTCRHILPHGAEDREPCISCRPHETPKFWEGLFPAKRLKDFGVGDNAINP